MIVFEDPAVTLPAGGRWLLDLVVTDDGGQLVDVAPTVTITRPDDTTTPATADRTGPGRYRAVVELVDAGRHVAAATAAGYGAAAVAGWVVGTTTAGGMPTSADVVAYMGPSSWTTDQIDEALAAESDAQRAVCRVGAYVSADLRSALLRRVQRALAMRRLPLAMQTGDVDAGAVMPPGRDPEVRRLEAPYRRMVMG